MKWENWISELEALPANASEWEPQNVAEFIEAVQNVARDKITERESGRKNLSEAISGLERDCGDSLKFFSLEDHLAWSAEHCSLHDVPLLIEKVKSLRQMLIKHSALLNSRPLSRLEMDDWYQSVDGLNRAIDDHYKVLGLSLSSGEAITNAEPAQRQPMPVAPLEGAVGVESESLGKPPLTKELRPGEIDSRDSVPTEAACTFGADVVAGANSQKDSVEQVVTVVAPLVNEEAPPANVAKDPSVNQVSQTEISETKPIDPKIEIPPVPTDLLLPKQEPPQNGSELHPAERKPEEFKVLRLRPAEPEPVTPPDLSRLQEPKVLAQYLTVNNNADVRQSFLWSLVAAGDLTGAYWLAQALQVAGDEACLANPWLLQAVQLSQWLTGDDDLMANSMFGLAINFPITEGESDEITMLRLAAAIKPALMAPRSGMDSWFGTPAGCPSVGKLIDSVTEFSRLGVSLYPENFDQKNSLDQAEKETREAANDVKRWLIESSQKKYLSAGNVWKDIKRGITPLLEPVADDQRQAAETVLPGLSNWLEPSSLAHQINEADLKHSRGKRSKRIDQNAREKLEREITEVCVDAKRWIDLVRSHEKQAKTLQQGAQWYISNSETLRNDVARALPEIERELALITAKGSPATSASALCLREAIRDLQRILNLETTARVMNSGVPDTSWLLEGSNCLEEAFSRRLYLLPELWLRETTLCKAPRGEDITLDGPSRDDLIEIPSALGKAYAKERSIRSLINRWMDKRDFRFIEQLQRLQSDEEARESSKTYHKLLAESREDLRLRINSAIEQIENAYLDGTIDEERSEYLAIVDSIVPRDEFNFPPQWAKLDRVRERLKEARHAQAQGLTERWREVEPQLTHRGDIRRETRIKIKDLIESALKREDVRFLEESISTLNIELRRSDHLTQLKVEDLGWDAPPNRDVLVEFLKVSKKQIDPWLNGNNLQTAHKAILDGNKIFGVTLPKPDDREAVARAVDAFMQLQKRPYQPANIVGKLKILLEFLGFQTRGDKNEPIRIIKSETQWLRASASLDSAEWARPIPQFAIEQYEIVCTWEKSVSKIGPLLQQLDLGTRSVILIYFNPMTEAERRAVAAMARTRTESIVLLDPNLLLFLTGEEENRLGAFLRCALPFSRIMPYTSKLDGDVPPNMFFGRQDVISE